MKKNSKESPTKKIKIEGQPSPKAKKSDCEIIIKPYFEQNGEERYFFQKDYMFFDYY